MLVSHMFQNLLIYSPPSFIAFKFLNAIDPSFNKHISFSVVIFVHRLTNTQNYLEKQTNKQTTGFATVPRGKHMATTLWLHWVNNIRH